MNRAIAILIVVIGASPSVSGAAADRDHLIPYMPAAADERRQGFVRVVNHGDESGTVEINAFDDAGDRFGPASLSIGALETRHFNSDDLETGNAAKGLSSGVGRGSGAWRVDMRTDLDVEVLAYVRTKDGFLTSMHALAPKSSEGIRIATFNPGENTNQVSQLRIVNLGAEATTAIIRGVDDHGDPADGEVHLSIPAAGARQITSAELETGTGEGASGALGDGRGKWRLNVASDGAIRAMSLLSSPTGHLTNLSTIPTVPRDTATCDGTTRWGPMFPSTAKPGRQGFLRVINRSDEDAVLRIWARDDAGRKTGPATLAVGGNQAAHLNSDDLEFGNPDKGVAGSVGPARDGSDWWLELQAPEEVETLAYVRTEDGFVTSMHEPVDQVMGTYHRIAIFNPGRNVNQVSVLRLVNPGVEVASVDISGLDDRGETSAGSVRVHLPAGGARTLTSRQLEDGGEGLTGMLGTGGGKWQLTVSSDRPIQAMSLLSSPTGHLTNLSGTTGRPVFDDRPKPDLIAGDIDFDDDQFLSFTLANRGSAEVPEAKGTVSVFVDGWPLREYHLSELADQSFRLPGGSQTVMTDLRVTGPNRRVAVVVDRNNEIVEVTEYQNALTRTVSLDAVDRADIVVRDVTLDAESQVEFALENIGRAPLADGRTGRLTIQVGDAAVLDADIDLPPLEVAEVVTMRPPSAVVVEALDRVRIAVETDAIDDGDNTNNSRESSLPQAAALEAFASLLAEPKIMRAIAWTDDDGTRDYGAWTGAEREDLNAAFLSLGHQESNGLVEPPAIPVADSDAWRIYLEHVAHSLWMELHNVVPWSLLDLDDEQLEHVLSFGMTGVGFGFRFSAAGWIDGSTDERREIGRYAFTKEGRIGLTDWSPRITWEFLDNLGLVRETQLATVAALTDWMRSHLVHWSTYNTYEEEYRYPYGLVDKDLYAFDGPHVTRGCPTTTNLYAAVLRTLNVPTYGVSQPLGPWNHTRPEFPTICRGLVHADDVHSSISLPSGPAVTSTRFLYTLKEMRSMFVDPPLECDGFCNTVGTQALVNSWRQDISQAHRDMTDWMLMWWTPERLAEEIRVGAYAGPLNAAIPIFDEDRIETILLDVERRQSQIGGGDVWSGKEEARVRHLRFEADK